MRDIIEMHSLSSYLRLATCVPATEFMIGVASLRNDDSTVWWHAVS